MAKTRTKRTRSPVVKSDTPPSCPGEQQTPTEPVSAIAAQKSGSGQEMAVATREPEKPTSEASLPSQPPQTFEEATKPAAGGCPQTMETSAGLPGVGSPIRESEPKAPLAKESETKTEEKPVIAEESPPARPAFNLDQLAATAWGEEQRGLGEDKRDLESSLERARFWAERTRVFREAMTAAIDFSARRLAECENTTKVMAADLQAEMQNKQEGLTLIGKMLARLAARLPQETEICPAELSVLGEARWRELLADASDETTARARIKRELADIAARRYQEVACGREAGDKARKALLSCVEKQVLPVLDALDDGEKHSAPIIARMKEQHSNAADLLQSWCATYGDLRGPILQALALVSVHPIPVTLGVPIEYDRHQPFDVEPDPGLPDEHIKALVRNGYEFVSGTGEACVLRAAQVVAVKNAPAMKPPEPAQNVPVLEQPSGERPAPGAIAEIVEMTTKQTAIK